VKNLIHGRLSSIAFALAALLTSVGLVHAQPVAIWLGGEDPHERSQKTKSIAHYL
jgi:hypothetical protein